MAYIRFITHDLDPDTGLEKGLLAAAYDAIESKLLTSYEQELIQEQIAWLKKNLPIPDRFSRTKNAYHKNTRGLSWLKPGAGEALERLRAIAAILEEHGKPVTMIKSEKPGYLVYEDDWQIVAEPFINEE